MLCRQEESKARRPGHASTANAQAPTPSCMFRPTKPGPAHLTALVHCRACRALLTWLAASSAWMAGSPVALDMPLTACAAPCLLHAGPSPPVLPPSAAGCAALASCRLPCLQDCVCFSGGWGGGGIKWGRDMHAVFSVDMRHTQSPAKQGCNHPPPGSSSTKQGTVWTS